MNVSINMTDILLLSPIIVLFLFSLIPLVSKVLNKNKEPNLFATLITAIIGLFLASGLLITFGGSDQSIFNGQLLFDGLTKWTGLIALFSVASALVMIYDNPSTQKEQFSEIVFLTMNSLAGMLVLVSAINLITVFIGLELMSLPLYLMIAMSQEQKLSKEAAIKYFVLGSLASALFLYGVSFIFGSAGTVHITELMQNSVQLIQTSKIFLIGTVFIVIGFCFKVSIVPFHAWTPDVYQGAPTPITSFMATAIKTASFAAFLRLSVTQIFQGSQNIIDVIQWLAVLTMVIGNVAALMQTNLKRTLAYSSIAHSGYMLIGVLTVGLSANSVYSASTVVFYLLTYSVMSIGAFAVLSMLEKSETDFVTTEGLAGLAKNNPAIAFCFTVFLISMAGLPPALGFFAKLHLFSAAVNEGLVWLALWGVINSVIAIYFYLKPIIMMYMKDGDATVSNYRSSGTAVLVFITAAIIIFVGVFSGPLFNMIEKSLS
jgi:NADH-quinone oxidoreductase subunit N